MLDFGFVCLTFGRFTFGDFAFILAGLGGSLDFVSFGVLLALSAPLALASVFMVGLDFVLVALLVEFAGVIFAFLALLAVVLAEAVLDCSVFLSFLPFSF